MLFYCFFLSDGQNNGEFCMEIDILFPARQKELLFRFFVCVLYSPFQALFWIVVNI